MSRALTLGAACALLVLGAAPPSSAQQTEAALLARLDSLKPLVEEAEVAAREAKARRDETARLAAARRLRTDTVRAGLVRIVAPHDQIELAERMFAEVWAEEYGTIEHSPALEDAWFVFQWADEIEPIFIDGPSQRVEFALWASEARVQRQIRIDLGTVIAFDLSELGTRIGEWAGGRPNHPDDVGRVYRELASYPSKATRGCLEGSLDVCWTALGLGVESNDIEAWYTPEERRELVARGGFVFGGRSEADDYARCVEDDVIAACDDLLTILGSRNSWQPLSASVRGTMLWLALDEGGEGAWARVLEDPSMSPSEALLYASGLTKEELTARWRAWLIRGRPEVYAALGTRSGLAVLWILVFAALAMRSTRWRLG